MAVATTRRRLLKGAVAVALIAFDPGSRSFASEAAPGCVVLPDLDGELLADAATLEAAADDFGHIVHRAPCAVLVPGSVGDVAALIRFAAAHGLKVSATRGIGESHSTQGQAQVEAGVIIDMSALSEIHEINDEDALVDAGVQWIDLLSAAVPMGKSPPTLTDFIGLTVGGTLSAGGIGGQTAREGFQVDNVLELDVVTGRGHLVRCSPTKHPILFHAVRAGLGQLGVIVRARVRLVDVPPSVRVYTAAYADLAAFMSDQQMLIEDGRFEYVEGSAAPSEGGGWVFTLEAAKSFAPGAEPDDGAMLAGLSFLPGTASTIDQSYFDFANRLAPVIAFLEAIGAWQLPHPWLNVFVPAGAAPAFIQGVLDATPPEDLGQGPVLIYPFKRSKVTAPFLRMPASEHVFLLSLLRTAIPPTPENVAALVSANRAIFEELTAIGGKRYPIDSVPMSAADWAAHFDPFFGLFTMAKAVFDPHHVLAPGQGIF